MSLSPRGSSAVGVGQPVKGFLIMMIGGVLAWISGQSWSVERGAGEVFQMIMAYATLAVVAVPAQLIAGRTGRPWLLALAGAFGLGLPWLFSLAVAREGQDVLLTALAYGITYLITWLTRAWAARWAEA